MTEKTSQEQDEWDVLIDIEYAEWLRPSIKDLVRRARDAEKARADRLAAHLKERHKCDIEAEDPDYGF